MTTEPTATVRAAAGYLRTWLETQAAHRRSFGTLDCVVVNAGIGKGTGRADANRATAMTDFVGALTRTEAALGIFGASRTAASC